MKSHIEVWTDDSKMQIDELLKAKRENSEYEAKVAMGKEDGYTRYYEAAKANNGIYFKIGSGFKQRLLNNIIFDEVGLLDPLGFTDPMKFLKKEIPKLPFKPRKYQLEAFLGVVKNRNHLVIIPTGGGKSLSVFLVFKYYWENNLKSILVVPTINLVDQMMGDFVSYNAPQDFIDNIQLIGGENKANGLDKKIVISTWQSLSNKMNEVKKYDVIFCDEAHKLRSDVLTEIFKQPCEIKAGCTGSFPIVQTDAMSLEQALGIPKRYVGVQDLMKLGLLTDTTIVPMFLEHPRKETRSGMKYQQQMKFFRDSELRMVFLSSFLQKLKGVSVALYNTTVFGEWIYESLTGTKLTNKKKSDFQMMKDLGVFFVSGSTKSTVREQIRKYLNNTPEALLVAQTNTLSTGINIPKLKNLVFAENIGKSFTLVIQSLGRVMRVHKEKGDTVYVFDLVDTNTYTTESYPLKHFWERQVYYNNEGHKIIEKEIKL